MLSSLFNNRRNLWLLLVLGVLLIILVTFLLSFGKVPSFFGKPVYVWLGVLLFFLMAFQVGVGLRWIPVNFNLHRWNGKLIIPIVIVGHAFFAVSAYFFGVKVQGF